MTSPRAPLQQEFEQGLAGVVASGAKVCVGLSGGLDSVVLLNLFHGTLADTGVQLSAVHVHHGLSANADAWAGFCSDLCSRLAVPLDVARVEVDRSSGLGLEAAAREARHGVYGRVDADWIALAHHADDAAETLLLRMLRGSGIKGLAGMAATRRIDARRRIVRPLLRLRRAELEAYAREQGLAWIEDESNDDRSLDRNFLRHEILARLDGRFSGFPHTWLRAADHAAEAQQLLDELALQDLGGTAEGLTLTALRDLPPPRARNALRWFLASHHMQAPDSAALDEMIRQMQTCGPGARLGFAIGGSVLKRHHDSLVLIPATDVEPPVAFSHRWSGELSLPVPELGGRIEFARAKGRGIAVAKVRETGWVVRSRTGGETLKPSSDGPRRTLKNLFQEHDIPEWERVRRPLLVHRDQLVWMPGLGLDAAYRAAHDEEGLEPRWLREGPPGAGS